MKNIIISLVEIHLQQRHSSGCNDKEETYKKAVQDFMMYLTSMTCKKSLFTNPETDTTAKDNKLSRIVKGSLPRVTEQSPI